MSVNEYGLKGQFGAPDSLKVGGVDAKVKIETCSFGGQSEKVEGKDNQGETIAVVTFNETESVSASGWVLADFANLVKPGVGFTLTVGTVEKFVICESFEITHSNSDLVRFSLSGTHYPQIEEPVAP